MIILKLICLFFAIWWTLVNVMRLIAKEEIYPVNILIQAIGIFGFSVIQFSLYK